MNQKTAINPVATPPVEKRVVLHFPGFEPLDSKAHHARYARSARQSAKAWSLDVNVGAFREGGPFDVSCGAEKETTSTRVFVFDHNELVRRYSDKALIQRLASGYASAARVIVQGGLVGYFRHAWRFGLFFVFPFALVLLALALSATIAAAPSLLGLQRWNLLWSVLLAVVFFRFVFLTFAARFHTLHLFADWDLAVALAKLDDPAIVRWLDRCKARVRDALREDADEYVITSHSMGSSVACHVVGMLVEDEPELFADKRVVFVTLGGAILQCALLRSARSLRARVGAIARNSQIFWLEIHCLTDVIHFYKSRVVALCGHADAPQASIATIRMRHMLTKEHYRKIRRDLLRVHRQYVLGSDLRSAFDFTLMTAGPLPAASFADFNQDWIART
ncbi:hypothetical protein [Rhizobium metallidurans]|uniref:Transmembrane protein n=1 Tax=Rhizobium metallidurans TaxID=1265931 RepID=A0A7W6CNL9_9HYPH|nr:hypothetical protein [Rhizobium metallidurans]MBB3962433.1 hypothetical protein [Rhizobium metallidurans]